jgi:DNA ligase (NAD+)
MEIQDNFWSGKTVVLTGTMSKPRGEIKKQLENLGAEVTNSVTKKTDILICGKNGGSKYQKAIELGIQIMEEEEISL